jgi:hypothetical protein
MHHLRRHILDVPAVSSKRKCIHNPLVSRSKSGTTHNTDSF